MKIYYAPAGTNNIRTKIYLNEKGLDIPLQPVDIMKYEHKQEPFLSKHRLGRLPVMELDDGTIITESMAICRYLEEVNPEPPLFGTTPLEKANIEMWSRRIELELQIYFSAILRNTQPFFAKSVYQVPEYVDACHKTVQDRFVWLNDIMGDTEYLAGDTFSVADITGVSAFLMIRQIKVDAPETLTNLHAWLDRVKSRDSVQEFIRKK